MEATGHHVSNNTRKKWVLRVLTNTENTNIVDSITREQVIVKRKK